VGKRKVGSMDILNRPQLLARIREMSSERNAALAAFIYLTGMRVTELLGTREHYEKVIKHYQKIDPYKPLTKENKILVKEEKMSITSLKKENVEIIPEDDIMLVHQVPCLKKKTLIPKRTIPIIISREREFVDIFLTYYNTLQPFQPLFAMSRQRAWQIINKEIGLFPHFLIHERCTYFVAQKNFTDLHLQKFRGWSDTKPAATYTHLSWEDLANKMR